MTFDGLHAETTEQVFGIASAVSNELGSGFLESICKRAMLIALQQAGLQALEGIAVPVSFRGVRIGNFAADILVNKVLFLERKVASEISKAHEAQLTSYLRATPV